MKRIRNVPPTRASRCSTWQVKPYDGSHFASASASRNARYSFAGLVRSTRCNRTVPVDMIDSLKMGTEARLWARLTPVQTVGYGFSPAKRCSRRRRRLVGASYAPIPCPRRGGSNHRRKDSFEAVAEDRVRLGVGAIDQRGLEAEPLLGFIRRVQARARPQREAPIGANLGGLGEFERLQRKTLGLSGFGACRCAE